ncbi:MAG TPA: amidohydrolase family protein [Chloroflexota bacterium]|nr:amidohydrolase family protein [Chloroflexota bacterium]
MRHGRRVFDSDTHGGPCAEVLEPFLDPSIRQRIPDLDSHKSPIRVGFAGEIRQEPYKHYFRFGRGGGGWGHGDVRVLGEAGPREGMERRWQKFMGTRFPTEEGQWDTAARLKDMDEEGVDVQLIVPLGANEHPDPEIEMAFIQAEHRFLNEFCGASPHRLKTMIVASARCVEDSVREIKRYAKEPWCVAVRPALPLDYPIDHPDLDPIWKAADEEGLCIVHHSFSWGYPGYRDLWDNPFLGRMASHPWAAMRAVAAFFGAGLMDRFPNLRFAVLESGFGWLPFWARRMDDQIDYVGYVADLKQKPSECMAGGRFFCSIVIHEGPDMVNTVNGALGDHILMFGSDYPHSESRFPGSVDEVLGWESLSEETLTKLFWENPVRAFGEP